MRVSESLAPVIFPTSPPLVILRTTFDRCWPLHTNCGAKRPTVLKPWPRHLAITSHFKEEYYCKTSAKKLGVIFACKLKLDKIISSVVGQGKTFALETRPQKGLFYLTYSSSKTQQQGYWLDPKYGTTVPHHWLPFTGCLFILESKCTTCLLVLKWSCIWPSYWSTLTLCPFLVSKVVWPVATGHILIEAEAKGPRCQQLLLHGYETVYPQSLSPVVRSALKLDVFKSSSKTPFSPWLLINSNAHPCGTCVYALLIGVPVVLFWTPSRGWLCITILQL